MAKGIPIPGNFIQPYYTPKTLKYQGYFGRRAQFCRLCQKFMLTQLCKPTQLTPKSLCLFQLFVKMWGHNVHKSTKCWFCNFSCKTNADGILCFSNCEICTIRQYYFLRLRLFFCFPSLFWISNAATDPIITVRHVVANPSYCPPKNSAVVASRIRR